MRQFWREKEPRKAASRQNPRSGQCIASLMAASLQFPKACQTHVASRLARAMVQAYNGRWRLAMQQKPYIDDYSPPTSQKQTHNLRLKNLPLRSVPLLQNLTSTLRALVEPVPAQSQRVAERDYDFLPSAGCTAEHVGVGRHRHHMYSRRPRDSKLADRSDNSCRPAAVCAPNPQQSVTLSTRCVAQFACARHFPVGLPGFPTG